MKGLDEQGHPLRIQDAARTETQRLLKEDGLIGPATLCFILGPTLALHAGFAEQLRTALSRLDRDGVAATIDGCLGSR